MGQNPNGGEDINLNDIVQTTVTAGRLAAGDVKAAPEAAVQAKKILGSSTGLMGVFVWLLFSPAQIFGSLMGPGTLILTAMLFVLPIEILDQAAPWLNIGKSAANLILGQHDLPPNLKVPDLEALIKILTNRWITMGGDFSMSSLEPTGIEETRVVDYFKDLQADSKLMTIAFRYKTDWPKVYSMYRLQKDNVAYQARFPATTENIQRYMDFCYAKVITGWDEFSMGYDSKTLSYINSDRDTRDKQSKVLGKEYTTMANMYNNMFGYYLTDYNQFKEPEKSSPISANVISVPDEVTASLIHHINLLTTLADNIFYIDEQLSQPPSPGVPAVGGDSHQLYNTLRGLKDQLNSIYNAKETLVYKEGWGTYLEWKSKLLGVLDKAEDNLKRVNVTCEFEGQILTWGGGISPSINDTRTNSVRDWILGTCQAPGPESVNLFKGTNLKDAIVVYSLAKPIPFIRNIYKNTYNSQYRLMWEEVERDYRDVILSEQSVPVQLSSAESIANTMVANASKDLSSIPDADYKGVIPYYHYVNGMPDFNKCVAPYFKDSQNLWSPADFTKITGGLRNLFQFQTYWQSLLLASDAYPWELFHYYYKSAFPNAAEPTPFALSGNYGAGTMSKYLQLKSIWDNPKFYETLEGWNYTLISNNVPPNFYRLFMGPINDNRFYPFSDFTQMFMAKFDLAFLQSLGFLRYDDRTADNFPEVVLGNVQQESSTNGNPLAILKSKYNDGTGPYYAMAMNLPFWLEGLTGFSEADSLGTTWGSLKYGREGIDEKPQFVRAPDISVQGEAYMVGDVKVKTISSPESPGTPSEDFGVPQNVGFILQRENMNYRYPNKYSEVGLLSPDEGYKTNSDSFEKMLRKQEESIKDFPQGARVFTDLGAEIVAPEDCVITNIGYYPGEGLVIDMTSVDQFTYQASESNNIIFPKRRYKLRNLGGFAKIPANNAKNIQERNLRQFEQPPNPLLTSALRRVYKDEVIGYAGPIPENFTETVDYTGMLEIQFFSCKNPATSYKAGSSADGVGITVEDPNLTGEESLAQSVDELSAPGLANRRYVSMPQMYWYMDNKPVYSIYNPDTDRDKISTHLDIYHLIDNGYYDVQEKVYLPKEKVPAITDSSRYQYIENAMYWYNTVQAVYEACTTERNSTWISTYVATYPDTYHLLEEDMLYDTVTKKYVQKSTVYPSSSGEITFNNESLNNPFATSASSLASSGFGTAREELTRSVYNSTDALVVAQRLGTSRWQMVGDQELLLMLIDVKQHGGF